VSSETCSQPHGGEPVQKAEHPAKQNNNLKGLRENRTEISHPGDILRHFPFREEHWNTEISTEIVSYKMINTQKLELQS
jgi:hypothetical protein